MIGTFISGLIFIIVCSMGIMDRKKKKESGFGILKGMGAFY